LPLKEPAELIQSNESEFASSNKSHERTFPFVYGTLSTLKKLCGVSRSTAYQWIEEGKIISKLIGGRRYIDFRSVEKLFDEAPAQAAAKARADMQRRRLGALAEMKRKKKAEIIAKLRKQLAEAEAL
jgi:hypothetical protein